MTFHAVVDSPIAHVPLDPLSAAVFGAVYLAVALLTLRRPALGIAALVALTPFALYRDAGPTTVTLPKAALLALLSALLIRGGWQRFVREPVPRALLLASAATVAATALSLAAAAHRAPAVRETLKALEYLALFAAVYAAARIDGDERIARVALAGTLALVSVLALAQEFTGAPSGVWFLGHPFPRIAGPLEGPNQLSGFLGIGLPVILAFALARKASGLEVAALACGSAALVLTLSRAGLATTAVALGVVVLAAPERRALPLRAIAAGVALGALLLLSVGYDLAWRFAAPFAEAEAPGAVGRRSQLWGAAWALWKTHPWLGIGAGNFELELKVAGVTGVRTHANSLYLQALAEGGVPLFAATLLTVYASLRTFARGPLREPLVLGALAASIGLALHQIVDLLVFYPKVGEFWWIVLALGAARRSACEPR